VFSNEIIVLTIVSVALIIIEDADVNRCPAVRDRRVHRVFHGGFGMASTRAGTGRRVCGGGRSSTSRPA